MVLRMAGTLALRMTVSWWLHRAARLALFKVGQAVKKKAGRSLLNVMRGIS
jgi:hypothetical protein